MPIREARNATIVIGRATVPNRNNTPPASISEDMAIVGIAVAGRSATGARGRLRREDRTSYTPMKITLSLGGIIRGDRKSVSAVLISFDRSAALGTSLQILKECRS